jgi:chromosome condensin MukBEF ATPase and DNA-binding subunit MukB
MDLKMSELEREIGGLQARMETVEQELHAIRQDVREIRDALVRAKGGWMVLVVFFTCAASVGGLLGRYIHVLTGPQP